LLKEFVVALYLVRHTLMVKSWHVQYAHCKYILNRYDQALKYRSENRLTKCSMTLNLGRTYVLWCPMTLSSVWLGNK
jgi:hypothetical protein